MTADFIRLNLDWNAEPNDPGERVEVDGADLRLSFILNPWEHDAAEGERADLVFTDCEKWRLGATNDEGWHRGDCRYSGVAPTWGEFYEIVGHDALRDAPNDWHQIRAAQPQLRHFLFYLRDHTFECVATGWRLVRQPSNVC